MRFNAGLVDATLEAVVLPIALFYGGIAQLLAGMWELEEQPWAVRPDL